MRRDHWDTSTNAVPRLNLPPNWDGPTGWAGKAACAGIKGLDIDVPRPKPHQREMCESCPVLVACLTDGLNQPGNKPGLYGGYSANERVIIKKLIFPNGASKLAVKAFLRNSANK